MSETRGFYSLWLREIKRFIRDRTRLVTSFVQPLLWLIIFGAAFAARIVLPATLNYQQVLLPGIVGQTLLFTAMFMGINVIWDKEFGFMKETLVAPVSRFTIFLGKMVGDSTDAFMQGIIVFAIGLAIGIPISPITVLYALPVMLLITFGLVSIGLTIASFMGNLGGLRRYPNIREPTIVLSKRRIVPPKRRRTSKLANRHRRVESVNLWHRRTKTRYSRCRMGAFSDSIIMG